MYACFGTYENERSAGPAGPALSRSNEKAALVIERLFRELGSSIDHPGDMQLRCQFLEMIMLFPIRLRRTVRCHFLACALFCQDTTRLSSHGRYRCWFAKDSTPKILYVNRPFHPLSGGTNYFEKPERSAAGLLKIRELECEDTVSQDLKKPRRAEPFQNSLWSFTLLLFPSIGTALQ